MNSHVYWDSLYLNCIDRLWILSETFQAFMTLLYLIIQNTLLFKIQRDWSRNSNSSRISLQQDDLKQEDDEPWYFKLWVDGVERTENLHNNINFVVTSSCFIYTFTDKFRIKDNTKSGKPAMGNSQKAGNIRLFKNSLGYITWTTKCWVSICNALLQER